MANKRSVLAAAVLAGLVTGISACGSSGTVQHSGSGATTKWVSTLGGGSVDAASVRHAAKRARDSTGYLAYLAFSTADEVVEATVTPPAITGTIADDTGDGVAVTPDDSTLYIADTGQYYVLAYDVATKESTKIEVGPYPQDVAISPSGSVVYATVTGGDTGSGGSDKVAVISTATNTVTSDIRVGTAPRQVVFSPDGSRAYVTCSDGVYVIDVASSSVVGVFRSPANGQQRPDQEGLDQEGPQGVAVSADGKTLYVTYPAADVVAELNAATGASLGVTSVGDEPYAVAAAGTSLYVTDMNDDEVSVVSTMTGKVTGTIAVGRLPMSIATTPDGTQVWVGNGMSGSVSVISVASGTVVATIGGGPGTSTLDAAPLGMAFAQTPS